MAIDKTKNDRISLTINKELKERVRELSELESRSLNSFILNAIKEYINNNYDEK